MSEVRRAFHYPLGLSRERPSMKIIYDLSDFPTRLESVVTIGAFDGVHLGHQALIRQLVTRARAIRCQAALITFHPHPSEVLTGRAASRYLTTLGEKAGILERLHIDLLAILAFTPQVASASASEFLAQVCSGLGMRELWVGPQFALGRGREGDIPSLSSLAQRLGFELRVVEQVVDGGEPVTSSRIRELILGGQVREAARLLGRFYSVVGEVVRGDHRGQLLGFPTANLKVREERILPLNGVYVGRTWVGEHHYPAVVNVGVRPTFGDHERLLEAHMLDFDGDLYGTDLMVEFVERLRPEKRFDSAQKLIAQMQKDKAQAQEFLAAEREVC